MLGVASRPWGGGRGGGVAPAGSNCCVPKKKKKKNPNKCWDPQKTLTPTCGAPAVQIHHGNNKSESFGSTTEVDDLFTPS